MPGPSALAFGERAAISRPSGGLPKSRNLDYVNPEYFYYSFQIKQAAPKNLEEIFPEKPMRYEKCTEVNEDFWRELAQADPSEVGRRTRAVFQDGAYRFPFLNRELLVHAQEQRLEVVGAEGAEPGFRLCLAAVLYLLRVDPAALGPLVSPLELPGGTTFFQKSGPHSLPNPLLEDRFGRDLEGFLAAGWQLGGESVKAGDGAFAFQVFPGIMMEVILCQADEEFPSQVSFTVPAHLDRFWHLDAVLGLILVLVQELLRAVPTAAPAK